MTIPMDARVVLDHVQLRAQNYSGRKFVQFCTIGCRLEACNFSDARIKHAQLGSGRDTSEFVECVFDGAQLIGMGGRCRFVRCSFQEIDGRDWIFNAAELIDCTMSGRLRHAVFSGSVPPHWRAELGRDHNEFRGSDFSKMELVDVTFRGGIDLSKQRLPAGSEYLYVPDAASVLDRALGLVTAWPASSDRETTLAILNALVDEVAAGQREMLLRPMDYVGFGGLSREGVERAFELVRAGRG